MKKLTAIILTVALLISLVACGGEKPKTTATIQPVTATPATTATPVDKNFEKPAEYASVLLVTINPQIRLYLDADGKVLAIEAVNEDALAIKDSITFANESVETVVKNIVTTANEKGFIKTDATISIELTEAKNDSVDKSDLLEKAKTTVNQTAADLKIEIVVKTEDKSDVVIPEATDTITESVTPGETTNATPGATAAPQTATPAPTPAKLTSVKEKAGSWFARYAVGVSLYDANFYLSGGADEISAGIGYRELVDDSLDADRLADAVEFEGKLYYGAAGGGDPLKSVTENGKTVIATDLSGNTIEFTRESETTLKVKAVSAKFGIMGSDVPKVGTVFTFKAAHVHDYSIAATCSSGKACECGATTGDPLGHDFKNGVCSRCKIKTVTQKNGGWNMRYSDDKNLFDVTLTLYGGADVLGISVGVGDPLSAMPPEAQAELKDDCVNFYGTLYYIGRGDGDGLASVTESNTKVTVKDFSGKVLELIRTDDNKMVALSDVENFAGFVNIKMGASFKFIAE